MSTRFNGRIIADSLDQMGNDLVSIAGTSNADAFTDNAEKFLKKAYDVRDDIEDASIREKFNAVLRTIRRNNSAVVEDSANLKSAAEDLRRAKGLFTDLASTLRSHAHHPNSKHDIENSFINAWEGIKSSKNAMLDMSRRITEIRAGMDGEIDLDGAVGDSMAGNFVVETRQAQEEYERALKAIKNAAKWSHADPRVGEIYENDLIELEEGMSNVLSEFTTIQDDMRDWQSRETKMRQSVIDFKTERTSFERGLERLTGSAAEAVEEDRKELIQKHRRSVGALRSRRNKSMDDVASSVTSMLGFLSRVHQKVKRLQDKTKYLD